MKRVDFLIAVFVLLLIAGCGDSGVGGEIDAQTVISEEW